MDDWPTGEAPGGEEPGDVQLGIWVVTGSMDGVIRDVDRLLHVDDDKGGLRELGHKRRSCGRCRSLYWCPERESNPHSFRGNGILSPARLPVPPSGHDAWIGEGAILANRGRRPP